MPLTVEAQAAAVRTANETIKAFARKELGIELEGMSSDVAMRIALAAVIVKLNDMGQALR
jgi:hypothetical protein